MKYLVSFIIALALFWIFLPNHHFTVKTWISLVITQSPIPTLMFTLERTEVASI